MSAVHPVPSDGPRYFFIRRPVLAIVISVIVTLLGVFAIFHGYAHGTENAAGGWDYVAGLIAATAALHVAGIAAVLGARGLRMNRLVPVAGAACMAFGVVLAMQAL